MYAKKSMIAHCPNIEMLSAFVQGQIADTAQTHLISQHLEQCEACIATLTTLQADDEFVDSLKRAVGKNIAHSQGDFNDSGYQQALERVLKIPDESFSQARRSTNNVTEKTFQHIPGDVADEPHQHPTAFGPYKLIEKIGEGGMGCVFRAIHIPMDRPVAIKLLPKNRLQEQKARKRFIREMQAIGKLNHPNIVVGHDAGEVNGQHFLAMELLDGVDLATLVAGLGKPLSYSDACELVRVTAIALKYAHKNGIVHRDVKPSNIMLCSDRIDDTCEQGEHNSGTIVKLLDLGLARFEIPDSTELSLTGHDQIMGTIDFMSPEQCVDSSNVDDRSDIYSLGATLFFLLVGLPPVTASGCTTQGQKIQFLVSDDVPSIRDFRNDLPDDLIEIVDRLLKRDPSDRYQDIRQLIDALAPFARAHGLAALLKTAPTPAPNDRGSDEVSVDQPDHPQPVRHSAVDREDHTSVQQQILDQLFAPPEKTNANRILKWTLLTLSAIIVIGISFSVYWLKTDGGYIRIETDSNAEVTVEVLKDGEKIENLTIGKDEKNHWYYSGQYQIRIPADQNDNLEIEGDQFTLTRGDNQLVKITKVVAKTPRNANPTPGVDESDNKKSTDNTANAINPIHPREVVQWVTTNGGRVQTERGQIKLPSEIPDGDFEIHTIRLWFANNEKVAKLVSMVTRLEKCDVIYLNGGPNRSVTDQCMSDVGKLDQVKRLTFESAQITDQGIQKLKRMPNLTSLGLLDLMVTEKCLASVSVKFPNLYRLELNSDSIAGSDLLPLTTMKQLGSLDLITPKLTEQLVKPLVATQIEQLIVRGAHSYEPGVAKTIAQMPKLTIFEIQNTAFGDEQLRPLIDCKSLKFLRIANAAISVDGMREFIDKRPEIIIYIDYAQSPLLELKNLPQVKDVSTPNVGPLRPGPRVKSK